MDIRRALAILVVTSLAAAIPAEAQTVEGGAIKAAAAAAITAKRIEIIESVAVESISPIRNAPFSADAVTEFTQTLGDGNRIERRYSSSVARDTQGRTRRQEQIAMVGPLAVDGPPPSLVTIQDPEAGVTYTLDQSTRVAYRNRAGKHVFWVHRAAAPQGRTALVSEAAKVLYGLHNTGPHIAVHPIRQAALDWSGAGTRVVTEALGTRTIEGVLAEGTRTTSTIPEGAIGNVLPIAIVSERWFSAELQEPVLITRRDPRSGDTTYRLTNIVRTEPPPDLFSVPPDYEVRDGALTSTNWSKKF